MSIADKCLEIKNCEYITKLMVFKDARCASGNHTRNRTRKMMEKMKRNYLMRHYLAMTPANLLMSSPGFG